FLGDPRPLVVLGKPAGTSRLALAPFLYHWADAPGFDEGKRLLRLDRAGRSYHHEPLASVRGHYKRTPYRHYSRSLARCCPSHLSRRRHRRLHSKLSIVCRQKFPAPVCHSDRRRTLVPLSDRSAPGQPDHSSSRDWNNFSSQSRDETRVDHVNLYRRQLPGDVQREVWNESSLRQYVGPSVASSCLQPN